jgi:hypothetical protein
MERVLRFWVKNFGKYFFEKGKCIFFGLNFQKKLRFKNSFMYPFK